MIGARIWYLRKYRPMSGVRYAYLLERRAVEAHFLRTSAYQYPQKGDVFGANTSKLANNVYFCCLECGSVTCSMPF